MWQKGREASANIRVEKQQVMCYFFLHGYNETDGILI